jgi:hypothetical protein
MRDSRRSLRITAGLYFPAFGASLRRPPDPTGILNTRRSARQNPRRAPSFQLAVQNMRVIESLELRKVEAIFRLPLVGMPNVIAGQVDVFFSLSAAERTGCPCPARPNAP